MEFGDMLPRFLRSFQVFDRRAFFPDNPDRQPEHQILVRWWGVFSSTFTSNLKEIIGSGLQEKEAVLDLCHKLMKCMDEEIDRINSLRKECMDQIKMMETL